MRLYYDQASTYGHVHRRRDERAARLRFTGAQCQALEWHVHDSTMGCRVSGSLTKQLWDAKFERKVERSQIQIVGSGAGKSDFADPLKGED